MKQQSLASQSGFEKYGRKSRRELFLDEMEKIVPWSGLEALVRPHYAKAGKGRQPVGLSIMLRTYFVQQWFNLSDPGVEEALYESAALRRFVVLCPIICTSAIVSVAPPRDPLILAGVLFTMLLLGLLASFIPARRTLAIDPAQLLRE
jgi:hypothetical protein